MASPLWERVGPSGTVSFADVSPALLEHAEAAAARGIGLTWYFDAMRTTIDMAGRLVVPKRLREQLGFAPGTELEITAADGHLEVSIPSRVSVEEGPGGVRFVADTDERLDAAQVRELMERGRR